MRTPEIKTRMKKTIPKNTKSKEGPNLSIALQQYQHRFWMFMFAKAGFLERVRARWRAEDKAAARQAMKVISANKPPGGKGR